MPVSNYTEVESDPRIVLLAEQVARSLIAWAAHKAQEESK